MERVNASLVWKHFEKCVSNENRKAICKSCKTEVSIPNRNTSNLRQHLKKRHSALFWKMEEEEKERKDRASQKRYESLIPENGLVKPEKRQLTLQQAVVGKWDKSNPRSKEITSKLTKLFCKDMLPFRLVGSKFFQSFVAECEPKYQLPGRAALSHELVPALYEETRRKIKGELKEANTIAFTTDMWTSVTVDGYMSLTGHYLDLDYQLKNRCLVVREVTKSHTASNLKSILLSVMDEYGVIPKEELPLFVVSDNGRNIQAALKEISGVRNLPCFAHTLQLVVNDSIDHNDVRGLKTVIVKCKNIVSYFHRSNTAVVKLKEKQKQLNLPQHKLVQDVPTRWDSQYLMLSRLIEQKEPVSALLLEVETVSSLTAHEWKIVHEACEALKPFHESTTLLSGSDYPTVSLVIPVLNFIVQFLKKESGLNNLKKILLKRILSRFGDFECHDVYSVATILDPRFKSYIFESSQAVEIVKVKITAESEKEASLTVQPVEENMDASYAPEHLSSSMSEYMNRKLKSCSSSSSKSCVSVELEQFLAEPVIARNYCPIK